MSSRQTIAAIRFGYGLSPSIPAPDDPRQMLEGLGAPDVMAAQYPVRSFAQVIPIARQFQAAQQAQRRNEAGAREEVRRLRRQMIRDNLDQMVALVQRGVQSPHGFRERLQTFWSYHFTVVAKSVQLLLGPTAYAEDAIRPHLNGHFSDMLRAAVTHPVMLLYLDQTRSVGPQSRFARNHPGTGLNENLGREVLELHTLGVGAPYTQTDVRQFSKLLTGLGFNLRQGFAFHPNWAQPGAELVLGRRYGGERPARLDDIYAALDEIAVHPATAHHIAHQLCVHFVSDSPDAGLVAHVTDAFRRSNGHLPQVYAALLEHPAAWAPTGAKVRQPWDYVVAGLRALGTAPQQLSDLREGAIQQAVAAPLKLMGQPFQRASGPNGWHEDAAAWITPQGLAARIQWAMAVGRLHGPGLPDPRAFVHTALADVASPTLITAAHRAESRREGVGLILASADFNRR